MSLGIPSSNTHFQLSLSAAWERPAPSFEEARQKADSEQNLEMRIQLTEIFKKFIYDPKVTGGFEAIQILNAMGCLSDRDRIHWGEFAAERNRPEISDYLFASSPTTRYEHLFESALRQAVEKENGRAVEILLTCPTPIQDPADLARRALSIGNLAVVKILLNGVKPKGHLLSQLVKYYSVKHESLKVKQLLECGELSQEERAQAAMLAIKAIEPYLESLQYLEDPLIALRNTVLNLIAKKPPVGNPLLTQILDPYREVHQKLLNKIHSR